MRPTSVQGVWLTSGISAVLVSEPSSCLSRKAHGTWRAVKAGGKIKVLRPAFLFYDEVTDDF